MTDERIKEIIAIHKEYVAGVDEFFNNGEIKTEESVIAWDLKLNEIKNQASLAEWCEFWQTIRKIFKESML